jgi:UDP-N-acetylglucosamine 2-epimerase
MTDSGGVIREAAELNIPCLVLRNEIEATTLLAAGKVRLVTTDFNRITSEATALIKNPGEIQKIRDLPFQTLHNVSEKIVLILVRHYYGKNLN